MDGHTIKTDSDKCLAALPEVARIARDLERNTGKKCKVDLIGGEVTALPVLSQIIDGLLAGEVDKVNITTNFELEPPAGNHITCTASYHPAQTKMSMEEWFEKAVAYKDKVRFFKVETVALYDSTHIDEFVRRAEEAGIPYQVEEDLNDKRCKGKGCSSTKPKPRYVITDDEGNEREFSTRNAFLKQYGIDGMYVSTQGMCCSREYDYVYVEQDRVFMCHAAVPVAQYEPLQGYHLCPRQSKCTLCGNISLKPLPSAKFDFSRGGYAV